MSGFAVLIDTNSPTEAWDGAFQSFLELTSNYKQLDSPTKQVSGRHCHAAKLDSPSSLHKGIVEDEMTGSWLLAAGTVVDITGSNSDASLHNLLRDYLEFGPEALQNYDGHFALIIYDTTDESLSVVSDPLGFFSIFYGIRGNQIFISSSALAVARQIQSKLDRLVVETYLRTDMVYGETTLWRDVKRVLPATILKFTDGKIRESEYWKLEVDEAIARMSFTDALANAVETISHTIELALGREGKIWLDLTGGFDTRLMATMVSKAADVPFVTNCVGPAGHPDVTISSEIAQAMGWEHRHISMPPNWAQEQCDWLETALHKGDAHLEVAQLASVLRALQDKSSANHVSVLGLGGEVWRGEFWRQELFDIGKTPDIDYDRLLDFRVFLSPVDVSVLREDMTGVVRQDLKEHFGKIASRYSEWPNTVKLDALAIYEGTGHSGAYLSAAAGILRSLIPLYFKAPTTFAFSLNYKWKHPSNHRLVRVLLEQENPCIANIRTTSGGPAVPMRITNFLQFWPFWKSVMNRVVRKFSRKLLGKPITVWPVPDFPSYPLPGWREGWLNFVETEGLLQPSIMRSADLYNAPELQRLASHARLENFEHDEFLRGIVTVEMAMRAVEADGVL